MSHTAHRQAASKKIHCYVITISDTRTVETDSGGKIIVKLLTEAGHEIVGKTIVPDNPDQVKRAVQTQLSNSGVDAVITTGGTGISSRDQTYEAINDILEKRIDGFGELFRSLSYHEVGTAAMLSRAQAGSSQGKIVVSIPGSENAVRLAVSKLLVPELGHLVRAAGR